MRLITAEQVIVGPASVRMHDAGVLLDGQSIVSVGSPADLAAQAPDAERSHHPGATLLPGLINAHGHLAFTPGTALDTLPDVPSDELLETMAGHARELLDVGVTTLRDVGDRDGLGLRLRDEIAAGQRLGPSLVCSGAPLTRSGGHCWFLGGAVRGEPGDTAALRSAVRATAATGADLVKVMASGGASTDAGAAMWEPQFSADELSAISDEARQQGLPVATHAHDLQSIQAAVDAGVSTVEHCSWMSGGLQFAPRDEIAPVVKRIAERGIRVCPGHPNSWDFFAMIHGEEDATEIMRRIRWLADHGVRLLHGTDAGLTPFADSTSALLRLGPWGFSGADLINMATVHPAAALGLDDTTGRLAEGLRADLVLVSGDPYDDPASLEHVQMVVAAGREHIPS